MSKERKVNDAEADYLGPVAVAQFVELGWIMQWPPTWSRVGLRAARNGYGRWDVEHPGNQTLPHYCERSPDGNAHWANRRTKL